MAARSADYSCSGQLPLPACILGLSTAAMGALTEALSAQQAGKNAGLVWSWQKEVSLLSLLARLARSTQGARESESG